MLGVLTMLSQSVGFIYPPVLLIILVTHPAPAGCLLSCVQGRAAELLTPLSIFALLVAAAMHDAGHDGLNNLYHQHALTGRALAFNDQSVQASTAFAAEIMPMFLFLFVVVVVFLFLFAPLAVSLQVPVLAIVVLPTSAAVWRSHTVKSK